ncbi:hypothetical protein Tco_0683640 [Tanacetum coccineum]
MVAVEVPQTLEYGGGQLNAAPILEVENFTNWKKRKPKGQWTGDEIKAANLDQRLKSLIMSVLPYDQMNSDEEEVASDDNEMVKVKVLMALAGEKDAISKEGARNG